MNIGLQIFVGVIAGAVMLVRVAAAIDRARIDGEIAARRARADQRSTKDAAAAVQDAKRPLSTAVASSTRDW